MAVHAYVRASTSRQKDSPEIQLETIRKYCLYHGLGDPLVYVDAATSGAVAIKDRDAGGYLFRNLKRGDHVVIAKIDRAFRRLSDCVNMLDELKRIGVNLHVCNMLGGAIDLSQPIGLFLIQVLSAFAELERAFIKERTAEGRSKVAKQGFLIGREAPYGFKKKKMIVDVDGVKKVRYVAEPWPAERAVMAFLHKCYYEKRMNYDEIRQYVQYNLKLMRPRTGSIEWMPGTIRLMILAEEALQTQEKNDNHDTGPKSTP